MVQLPEHTVTQKDLEAWYQLQLELKRIKASEMLMRMKIFKHYFPAPAEGTNTAPLADGYVIKATYPITRDVDPGALQALKDTLLEQGVRADELVQYKPSLVVKEYRTLTAEQQHLFDQCLIIKPGSPGLEIVLPAKNKPKAGDVA